MEAVRQLDQDHSDVLDDGQQHLAERARLPRFGGLVAQPPDLGDAIDAERDVFPEFALDQAERGGGVLDRVVQ